MVSGKCSVGGSMCPRRGCNAQQNEVRQIGVTN